MSSELNKRLLLEFIEDKYKSEGKNRPLKIRVTENDFHDMFGRDFSLNDMPELILGLEKQSNGKIKLINTKAVSDNLEARINELMNENFESGVMAGLPKYLEYGFRNPYYWSVLYNPKLNTKTATNTAKNGEYLLTPGSEGDDKSKTLIENKKYSDANEDVILTLLGIKIKGNYVIRGTEKIKINSTDKALIYYLFYKSIKNKDACFTLNDLSNAKEIEKSERYIKNRITFINQSIRNIISRKVRAKIPRFITKGKNKRGYQLNPKILHIKPKK